MACNGDGKLAVVRLSLGPTRWQHRMVDWEGWSLGANGQKSLVKTLHDVKVGGVRSLTNPGDAGEGGGDANTVIPGR